MKEVTKKFPQTRFQGSKYKLREWIISELKDIEFDSVLDAFSGTGVISYELKKINKKVYVNDILRFNYYIGKALIENNNTKVNEEEINKILKKKEGKEYNFFIRDTFEDIYYTKEENEWLDVVIQNIMEEDDEYKQAIFYWALFQAAISKRPYNLFHRKNLYVRLADRKRTFGNKATWDRDFEIHFRKFINEANQAVFSSNIKSEIICEDVFNLSIEADLVYIDTPYIPKKGSLTKYGDFYHFLNGIVDYNNWKDKIDYKSKNLKLISEYSIWEDKKRIKDGFKELIEKYKKSKIAISYRKDGIPDIGEIVKMLEGVNKKVKVKEVSYKYALSKKKDTKEVLIIGE